MSARVATTDVVQLDTLEAVEQLVHRGRREHAQVCRVVLGRLPPQEPQTALNTKRVGHRAGEHAARPQDAADLRDERIGELEMLEELAGDDRIEALLVEGEPLLHVRLYRLDPERGGLLERSRVDVQADDRVALEEATRQRARAAAEVEHALPAADRRNQEGNTLRDEDEVALVSPLTVVLFVALAEVRHAEPTAASLPSDAIVRRRPSSSSISGSQPRICLARVMSG